LQDLVARGHVGGCRAVDQPRQGPGQEPPDVTATTLSRVALLPGSGRSLPGPGASARQGASMGSTRPRRSPWWGALDRDGGAGLRGVRRAGSRVQEV